MLVISPRGPRHPKTSELDLPTVLRTVGDPLRLTMIRLLEERGELLCGQISEELGLPISTCSYHLRLLREAGVTRTRVEGTERAVSLRVDDLETRFPGLVGVLLDRPASQPPGSSRPKRAPKR